MGYLPLAGTLVTPSGICQAHPGLDLRLQTALSAEVSALVLRGDAALGLRYGTDPGLVSVIIHHERLVPVCPPGHPLSAGPADLDATAPDATSWRRLQSGPFTTQVTCGFSQAGVRRRRRAPL